MKIIKKTKTVYCELIGEKKDGYCLRVKPKHGHPGDLLIDLEEMEAIYNMFGAYLKKIKII